MAKTPRSLAGRVVAVTGGGRGIGRATAAALVAQGAQVAIGDIEAELAERTAAELGHSALGLPLDVTDRDSFKAFLDQVEDRLGPLDVLINNAGIMPVGPFLEETDTCAERMVEINLHGVILGSKLALERFVSRRSGHLVNISSIAGKGGAAFGATYSATKFGVVGLSEGLLAEFYGTGIEVSVVMPIGVNTELYSGVAQLRGFKTPEPEDVAAAIVSALQRPRFEVYVPRSIGFAVRSGALMPRKALTVINRLLKSDQALAAPDHTARAAYEERMQQTINRTRAAGGTSQTPPSETSEVTAAAAAPARSNGG